MAKVIEYVKHKELENYYSRNLNLHTRGVLQLSSWKASRPLREMKRRKMAEEARLAANREILAWAEATASSRLRK